MRELTITAAIIPNTGKLDGELKAALAAKYLNLSTSGRDLIIRLDDATTTADDDVAETVVANHDPTPIPDQLLIAWQTIQQQTASRPLANMDFNQVKAWITANIADANTRTGMINIAEELFIIRAQMSIVARALAALFNE